MSEGLKKEKKRERRRKEEKQEMRRIKSRALTCTLGNEVGQVGKKQDRREKKVQDLRNLLCGIQYTAQYYLHPIAASLPLHLGRCLLHLHSAAHLWQQQMSRISRIFIESCCLVVREILTIVHIVPDSLQTFLEVFHQLSNTLMNQRPFSVRPGWNYV